MRGWRRLRRAGRRVSGVLRQGRSRIRRWILVRAGRLPADRPPCIVGIPMMNLHRLTRRVVDDLDFDELDELVIYDHGSDDPATLRWLERIGRRPKVTVDRRGPIPRESLYRSWNDTIRRALRRYPGREVDVVLLNNDLRLPDGFLGVLTRPLRSGDGRVAITYPDTEARLEAGVPSSITLTPTRGLAAQGGMVGWAFAVRAELFGEALPFIDERLKFYSGDRDLVHAVETRGYYAARVNGLACRHHWGATRRRRPELDEQKQRDMTLWWSEHRKG